MSRVDNATDVEISLHFEESLKITTKNGLEYEEGIYEETFCIEKTAVLPVEELTALQRHTQAVTRYLKMHKEMVPDFQDITFASGRINNLTLMEEVKLQLVWMMVLRVLANVEGDELKNFDKKSSKQRMSICKNLFSRLLPLLPKGSFNTDGEPNFSNDLEVKNFILNPEEVISSYLETDSVDSLMLAIEANPIASNFFSQAGTDDPDALLLRFLRARKWKLIDALQMAICTFYWHHSFGVSELLLKGELGLKEYLLTCGKHYAWNVDHQGRLIIWITSKLHDKNKQTLHENLQSLVYLIEHARRLMAPGTENVSLVFDLADAPLSSLDIPSIQGDIQILQNYYPECLGQCFVVDAPWIFYGVYAVVKTFLDPVVVSKINLIKSSEIVRCIHPSMVPKRYPGGCDPIEYVHSIDPENAQKRINPDLDLTEIEKRLGRLKKELVRMTLHQRPREAFNREGKRASLRMDLGELTKVWETAMMPPCHHHRVGVLTKENDVDWTHCKLD